MKKLATLLVLSLLLVGFGAALETQQIPVKVTVVKDGVPTSFSQTTNITIASPPPKVSVKLWVTTPNGTAPYAGPYQNGTGIRVNCQARLVDPGTCADRIIVEAPVINVTSGQVELRAVIDTKPYAPNGWCSVGTDLGAHWDYLAGFPLLDEDGNPVI